MYIYKYPKRIITKFFCILLLSVFSSNLLMAYANEIFIIANPSVKLNELTRSEVKKLYTGKTQSWDNGEDVILTYLKNNNSSTFFIKSYVHKSPRQFINHWRNQIFTGRAYNLPKGFNDETALLKYISNTNGAVGYVTSKQHLEGVKVLQVK